MDGRLSTQEVEALVARAQRGDNAAVERVLKHFENDIRKIAHSGRWFILGGDPEDIAQEARIGLYNAIYEYDPNRSEISFEAFALKICVHRAIITAINRENRKRMDPLNHGVSLSTPTGSADDGADQTLEEFIPDQEFDLEEIISNGVELSVLDDGLRADLTEMECQSYLLYKDGHTYREIAAILSQTEKTVDNALMRVRKKARIVVARYLASRSLEDGESLPAIIKRWGLTVNDDDGEMFWQRIIEEAMDETSTHPDDLEDDDMMHCEIDDER